jgi:hypothetical protein
MALSAFLNAIQLGEPARMDALWEEHERLKRVVSALAELLVAKGHLTQDEIDRLVENVMADAGHR